MRLEPCQFGHGAASRSLVRLCIVLAAWRSSRSDAVPVLSQEAGIQYDGAPFPQPDLLSPQKLVKQRPAPLWPNKAWCVGDTIQGSMRLAAVAMMAVAGAHDCTKDPNSAKCSRDIFGALRNSAMTGQLVNEALTTCGNRQDSCSKSITTMLNGIFMIGEAGSNMDIVCNKPLKFKTDMAKCGQQLERIAWHLDPLSTVMGKSVSACTADHRHEELEDAGACSGEILSSAAYVAAFGMGLAAVAESCAPSALGESREARALCGAGVANMFRQLSLAAAKISRAVTHCGGPKNHCGREVGRMSAALFGAVEWSQKIYLCSLGELEEWTSAECAEASAGLVKELSMTAAKAIDVSDACRDIQPANTACGVDASKAIAAFGFATEKIADAVPACHPPVVEDRGMYSCSLQLEFVGQAVDMISVNIGNAAMDCTLGPGAERKAPEVLMPRRFFT